MNRKAPSPWASASAAAFWACCTWKLFRSGWNGNTTWTSLPPPPTWFTGSQKPTGRSSWWPTPGLPGPHGNSVGGGTLREGQPDGPQEYVGNIMDLCTSRRGEFKNMVYLDANRVEMHYEMPLNEIIYDFFDALKSRTRGYGSLDYEMLGYRPSRLVKLDILLNGDIVDALSFILFADNAYPRARKNLRKAEGTTSPGPQFEIPVRRPSAEKLLPGRPSRPSGRTCWPSATAATLPGRKSCWKSRRKAKNGCGPSAPCRSLGGLHGGAEAGRRLIFREEFPCPCLGRKEKIPLVFMCISPFAAASASIAISIPWPARTTSGWTPHQRRLRPYQRGGTAGPRLQGRYRVLRRRHPQLSGGDGLATILSAVRKYFDVTGDAEITF